MFLTIFILATCLKDLVAEQDVVLNETLIEINLKFQYLEERILSLEEPAWTISGDSDRWKLCSKSGPCTCTHMTRTVNCWNLFQKEGIPENQVIPWDVQYLDLGENVISTISSKAFHRMTKLLDLNMFHTQLEYIPKLAFRHLHQLLNLKLSNNLLTNLEPSLLRNVPKLRSMDLSSNRIRTIPKTLFFWTTELQSLQLSHNSIEDLSECPFETLVNLKNLDISKNKLKMIEACFTKLKSLEQLDLSGNQLTSIGGSTFAGLERNLSQLHLVDNLVETLEERSFTSLIGLKSLNLKNNALKTFDPSVLPSQLINLDLSRNLIEKVKKSNASPIDGLVSLDLSSNNLESVSHSLFVDQFPNLQILKLTDNLLKEINPATTLPSGLLEFHVNRNQLEMLTSEDIQSFSSLVLVKLDENFWKCDCKNIQMAKWIRSKTLKVDDVTCAEPEDFQFQPLTEVILDQMNCE